MTKSDSRVIVALDFPDMTSALDLVARLDPGMCAVKVGKELFTAAGPAMVHDLVGKDFRVFLDLKYHDIPNTVAQACAAAVRLGVWMLNVHVAGGSTMLVAAREAVASTAAALDRVRPLLIGVTLLTSMDANDLSATGVAGTAEDQVLRLAHLAQASGLDGVVCSAREVVMIRAACGGAFKLVTPGIRPSGTAANDQVRVMTPEAAVAAGSDYLVIGRAITAASDPLRALRDINASIGAHV